MGRIALLVGLGNPGPDYRDTRHNAGQWFVDAFARRHHAHWQSEKRFFGELSKLSIGGHDLRLLQPSTYMNQSGRSVAAVANYFRIPPEAILIAYDELDLPPGVARFKNGGSRGSHNGLRDTTSALGNNSGFHRLRIGIGHPGHPSKVTGWVLGKPSADQRIAIDSAIDAALDCTEDALAGDWQAAMNRLHTFDASNNDGI